MGVLVGPLAELEHDVSGTVFIVSNTQLRIYNFNYDGEGPGASTTYAVCVMLVRLGHIRAYVTLVRTCTCTSYS